MKANQKLFVTLEDVLSEVYKMYDSMPESLQDENDKTMDNIELNLAHSIVKLLLENDETFIQNITVHEAILSHWENIGMQHFFNNDDKNMYQVYINNCLNE